MTRYGEEPVWLYKRDGWGSWLDMEKNLFDSTREMVGVHELDMEKNLFDSTGEMGGSYNDLKSFRVEGL